MRNSAHKRSGQAGEGSPDAPRRCLRTTGYGVAALVAATGLVMTGVPSVAAASSGTQQAPAADPTPRGKATTDTPKLVTGLNDKANGSANAADAAREHLGAHPGRYHIDNPGQNLEAAGTESRGDQEVVRLQQKYQGIEVLGAEYVVRMKKTKGERTVTGTSGKYFTRLDLATVTPKVSEKVAIERAVAAVATEAGGLLRKDATKVGVNSLTGSAQGLTVLPQGEGVLTRHITVSGVGSDGMPVKQEVYVDANAGFPLLQYSSIKSFTGLGGDPAREAVEAGDSGTVDAASTPENQLVTKGSGVRYNGETAELNLYKWSDGTFKMIDYSKRPAATPFQGALLATYDARGREASHAAGRWPSGITYFSSPTTHFGQEATDAGAVDAHWAAGEVYDYYRDNFGRAGLDGKDGFIYSLVGVVNGGQPFNNAFWDGTKMVYGQGGGNYNSFSADADVVGHEMTHGVIEHSANLIYAGQPGAMNEAVADYFGNAIDLATSGMSMDHPDAGLLGEGLCTTVSPRECALRDLNDGATTDDLLGVTYRGDSGGVHLNSTIFSGALWDLRQELGSELADQIVYRALTAYMTPLDGFNEGRDAVLAAASELGATRSQLSVVEQSFAAHGLQPGWERALNIDTDLLLAKNNIANTGIGAAEGKYVVSRTNEEGSEPYSVWLGNTDGTGHLQLMSANNGNYHVYADTDGETAAWVDYTSSGPRFMARSVNGGPAREYPGYRGQVTALHVDGDLIVYSLAQQPGGLPHVAYIDMASGKYGLVYNGAAAVPSVGDGKIAYAKLWVAGGRYQLGVEVFDPVTSERTLMPIDPSAAMGIGQTAITDDGVFWIEDNDITDRGKAAVRRAALDGSNAITVTPETGTGALDAYSLTASDDAVTVTTVPIATTWANETLPKLYQVAPDGKKGAKRMSCNRGDQVYAAADEGTRVLWFDGTTGYTDVVKRDRPAGKC